MITQGLRDGIASYVDMNLNHSANKKEQKAIK